MNKVNLSQFNFICLNCGLRNKMTLESKNFKKSNLEERYLRSYYTNCKQCEASFDVIPQSLLEDNFNDKMKIEVELETLYSSAAILEEKEFYLHFLKIRRIDIIG